MLKFWTLAFIGITLFASVAICDDNNSFENVTTKLVANLPEYLKDAIREVEYENSANAINAAKKFKFPWPKFKFPTQCIKDYLRIYRALLRKEDRTWALSGIVLMKCK